MTEKYNIYTKSLRAPDEISDRGRMAGQNSNLISVTLQNTQFTTTLQKRNHQPILDTDSVLFRCGSKRFALKSIVIDRPFTVKFWNFLLNVDLFLILASLP